jgi:hypothetical protein
VTSDDVTATEKDVTARESPDGEADMNGSDSMWEDPKASTKSEYDA